MSKKAVESAPTFSYHNSYSGLGSDLLNVAEDDKKLQDWHNQQLKLFDDFLQTSNKSGGNITVTVPVNVGNSGLTEEDAKAIGGMVKQSVLSVLDDQIRPGGKLNRR